MRHVDEVLNEVGCSYRQLDHWTSKGWVEARGGRHPGTGTNRTWPPSEVAIAKMMVRLIAVGFATPSAAHVARQLAGSHGTVELEPGIRLVVARQSVAGEGVEQPDGSVLFSERRVWVWP